MIRPAHQTARQILALPRPQVREREDRYFLDAFADLARGLSPRPEPRYLFDDAVSKGRSYWHQLVRAHCAVIDAGQDLSQALAFARALDGYVRMRVAVRDGVARCSVPAALRDLAWIDAQGDVARMEVATELTPGACRQLLESIDREMAALQLLKQRIQHELAVRAVA